MHCASAPNNNNNSIIYHGEMHAGCVCVCVWLVLDDNIILLYYYFVRIKIVSRARYTKRQT